MPRRTHWSALLLPLVLGGGAAPGRPPLRRPVLLLFPHTLGDAADSRALVALRARLRADGQFSVVTFDPEAPSLVRAAAEAKHPEWLTDPVTSDAERLSIAHALGASYAAVITHADRSKADVHLLEAGPAARVWDYVAYPMETAADSIERDAPRLWPLPAPAVPPCPRAVGAGMCSLAGGPACGSRACGPRACGPAPVAPAPVPAPVPPVPRPPPPVTAVPLPATVTAGRSRHPSSLSRPRLRRSPPIAPAPPSSPPPPELGAGGPLPPTQVCNKSLPTWPPSSLSSGRPIRRLRAGTWWTLTRSTARPSTPRPCPMSRASNSPRHTPSAACPTRRSVRPSAPWRSTPTACPSRSFSSSLMRRTARRRDGRAIQGAGRQEPG